MQFYKEEWLPHLNQAIPPEAKRNRISLYLIALEGYRRGLTLTFYNEVNQEQNRKLIYSLSTENSIHYFNESSGDANTDEAFYICGNKGLTEDYLQQNNVPIPKGKVFTNEHAMEEVIDYANKLTYPLVAKPTDGSGGRGVFANINNEQELQTALKTIWNQLEFKEILVQQHVIGDEIRVYVLGDAVLAAANRVPANIIGDGEQTINQLIRNKNELRKSTPHLFHRPIKIDNEVRRLISEANYTLDTVLPNGERLFLREISNISTGGDPVDVTDELTIEQKNIAIQATKAIPGLTHSGVDIIINPDTNATTVLEVNTRPGIGSHIFPIEGQARDIPKALIDYYFPETIDIPLKEKIYFDLQGVFDALNSGTINELALVAPSSESVKAKKYIINTNLSPLQFHSKIKRYIIENNINGKIIILNDDQIVIITAHQNESKLAEFLSFLRARTSLLQIKHIEEEAYDKTLQIGFHVEDGLHSKSTVELESEQKQAIKDFKIVEKEVKRLNKRINHMKKSNSWKITAPLRLVSSKLSGKK